MVGVMAARIRPQHQDEVRAKIQASQLVNRLNNIAMGKVAADPVQVSAAKALLNKVLPDLKAMEMTGADGRDLIPSRIERVVVKPDDK